MATYHIKSPLSISLWEGGGEVEIDAIISWVVHPGCDATLETPAEGPTVEVRRFQLASGGAAFADCPDWLFCRFEGDDGFNNWLLQEASERDEAARDYAAEARAEDRRAL